MVLLLAGAGCIGHDQQAEPAQEKATVAFPDTAAGKRAHEVLDLLRQKDESAVERFVTTRFAPTFRDALPIDEHAKVLANIRARHPGLVLHQVMFSTEYETGLLLESSASQSWLRLALGVEPESPHRISWASFALAGPPDPA